MLKKENVYDNVIMMLLGPSKRLKLRQKVKARLCDKKRYGYPPKNIIIMEDVRGDANRVIKKFGNILDKSSPQLFFAMLESNTKVDMGGVIFELGWLCGKYNKKEISERLRIIIDFDFRYRKTTRYVQSLIQSSRSLAIPINKMNIELIADSIANNVTYSVNVYHKE